MAGVDGAGVEVSSLSPSLVEFPSLLAHSATGIAFIYQALEVVAARYQLRDAIIAIETQKAGHQIFRLRRLPAGCSTSRAEQVWLERAMTGPPGLHTDPDVVDRVTASYVFHLAEVALRLAVVSHDAGHDPLTGLLNRRSYQSYLQESVSRARRYGWPFALIVVDLDDFKVINDRFGHSAGDDALRAVGVEVRALLRSGDIAARLGGDEFALVMHNAETREVVEPLVARLRTALTGALPGLGLDFSYGWASFPADAADDTTLTSVADRRLYQAKKAKAP